MKQVDLDVTQPKNDTGIEHIIDEHKAIFNYIEKLENIASQPQNYRYAIIILESFIAFFLEHVIKEEQLLQQYLPTKIVEEHAVLHQSELNYLDESLSILKVKLSSHNIKTIVSQLKEDFKIKLYQYDTSIMQQLIEQKYKVNIFND